MSTDPNINRVLADRYHLIDLVGQGAMGRVYRGEDSVLGNVTVAVKFLAQTLLNDKMRERFEREATICALLSEKSIHIVRVREYGVDEQDIPFYVMEFLQGESLSDIITKSVLTLPRFFQVVRQVCLGMEAAHKGITFKGEQCTIIHRDIKPSNILIVQDPSLGELVKVLDFGIAKLSQAGAAQTHSFMGTLAYCSPEQMEGKELDHRSDIYSFGIMMYEMLTGDMPVMPETNSFGGWYRAHHDTPPTPFDPNLRLPDALVQIIMRCMAKNPDDRPQRVEDIWRAMEPLAQQHRQLPKVAIYPEAAIAVPDEVLAFGRMSRPEEETQVLRAQSPANEAIALGAAQTPVIPSEPATVPIEIICAEQTWPADKPLQKIVFPRIITRGHQAIASLWTMLDTEELNQRRSNTRYNQFLFLELPHPMLLWITVLYNSHLGARWLPCYLDMKTPLGQQMARLLAQQGNYHILLFDLAEPEQYRHLTQATIAEQQREQLLHWAEQSHKLRSTDPNVSKNKLKQEYEKIKGSILIKLAKAHTSDNLAGYSAVNHLGK